LIAATIVPFRRPPAPPAEAERGEIGYFAGLSDPATATA
jgi:hypothetical protein